MKIPCVYVLDLKNNSYYIGQTKDFHSRMRSHERDKNFTPAYYEETLFHNAAETAIHKRLKVPNSISFCNLDHIIQVVKEEILFIEDNYFRRLKLKRDQQDDRSNSENCKTGYSKGARGIAIVFDGESKYWISPVSCIHEKVYKLCRDGWIKSKKVQPWSFYPCLNPQKVAKLTAFKLKGKHCDELLEPLECDAEAIMNTIREIDIQTNGFVYDFQGDEDNQHPYPIKNYA